MFYWNYYCINFYYEGNIMVLFLKIQGEYKRNTNLDGDKLILSKNKKTLILQYKFKLYKSKVFNLIVKYQINSQ